MRALLTFLVSISFILSALPATAQLVPPSESVEDEPVTEEGEPPMMEVAPQTQTATPPEAAPAPPANIPAKPAQPAPAEAGAPKETPVTLTPAAPPPAAPVTTDEMLYSIAVLQGINKVTARAETIEAPVGEIARFGNLEVMARTCWQAPPEERPENAALLEVWELKPGEGRTQIFNGWMFSSSPSLSSLSHPVYDLTVLECQARKEESEKQD